MRGFASAEGCYLVKLLKSPRSKLKTKVQLVFQLTQHSRDDKLMRSLVDYFDCGNIYKDGNNVVFRVSKFEDLENKILPFFQKYPIIGVKNEDFQDFCRAVLVIKSKKHLTMEGLRKIVSIRASIN